MKLSNCVNYFDISGEKGENVQCIRQNKLFHGDADKMIKTILMIMINKWPLYLLTVLTAFVLIVFPNEVKKNNLLIRAIGIFIVSLMIWLIAVSFTNFTLSETIRMLTVK